MLLKQYRTIEQMCSDAHSITLTENIHCNKQMWYVAYNVNRDISSFKHEEKNLGRCIYAATFFSSNTQHVRIFDWLCAENIKCRKIKMDAFSHHNWSMWYLLNLYTRNIIPHSYAPSATNSTGTLRSLWLSILSFCVEWLTY